MCDELYKELNKIKKEKIDKIAKELGIPASCFVYPSYSKGLRWKDISKEFMERYNKEKRM